jgi:hypothetical protein
VIPKFLTNGGAADGAQDFRDAGTFDAKVGAWFGRINRPERNGLVRAGARKIFYVVARYSTYRRSRALGRYFE